MAQVHSYGQRLARLKSKAAYKKDAPLQRFNWVLIDAGNCEIGIIQQVEARHLGHAMQKIAASLPSHQEEIHRIEVWRPIQGAAR